MTISRAGFEHECRPNDNPRYKGTCGICGQILELATPVGKPRTVPGLYTQELSSGNFVEIPEPDADAITFMDVVYGLSNTCRYNGHTGEKWYSVAEHAVLVASRLEALGGKPNLCLAGLHHDDAEALTGDITRPLKKHLGYQFEVIERVSMNAVVKALNLGVLPFSDPAVKLADDWALQTEAAVLMPSKGAHWHTEELHGGGLAPWDLGLEPKTARLLFIQTHDRLAAQMARGWHFNDEETP